MVNFNFFKLEFRYNTQDEPTVFLTVAITSSVVGQGQYVCHIFTLNRHYGLFGFLDECFPQKLEEL